MSRQKKPETTHHRYIFVDEFEKDQGFRDYLAQLARIGMRNAGIFGVAGPIIHFSIIVLLTGKEIAWFCRPGGAEYSIQDLQPKEWEWGQAWDCQFATRSSRIMEARYNWRAS